MKVLMICNTDSALYVFRKPLIERLIRENHSIVSITSGTQYLNKLSELRVKPIVLEFANHSTSLFDNIKIIIRLKRLIADVKPDIVHSFTHKPAIYGTLAAKLSSVKKIFVTITGLGTLFSYDNLRTKIFRYLLLSQYKFALKYATRVFFQNPDDMKYFIRYKLIDRKKSILTNGSGIDLQEFALPDDMSLHKNRAMIAEEIGYDITNKIIILFPAKTRREKGFFEFYEAAKIINSRSRDFVFIHLGLIDKFSKHSISRQNVLKLAKKCGVHYLGFKDNIADYMTGCDAVVLPSYREGTPHSLIGALALGKFIITTDVPGCRETVINRWNGFLCRPADRKSLAEKIIALDDALLKKAVLRSRRLCEEKYDVEKLVETTLGQYFQ